MEQPPPPPPKKYKPTGHYINRWKNAKTVFYRIGGLTTKENKALAGLEIKKGEGISAALVSLQTLIDQQAPNGLSDSKRLAWYEARLKALNAAFAKYNSLLVAYLAMLDKAEKLKPPGGVTASAYLSAIKTLEAELKAYKADLARDIALAEQYVEHFREHGSKAVAVRQKVETTLKRAAAMVADAAAAAKRVRADRMQPFEVYDSHVGIIASQLLGGLRQLNTHLTAYGLAVPDWIMTGVARWTNGTPDKPKHGLLLEDRLKALAEFDELIGAVETWLEQAQAATRRP